MSIDRIDSSLLELKMDKSSTKLKTQLQSPFVSLIGRLKFAYHVYVCYSPIPVMSKDEVFILNAINLALVSVFFYWAVHVLPNLLIKTVEQVYYYTTGNLISIRSVLGSIVAMNFWTQARNGTLSNDAITSHALRYN